MTDELIKAFRHFIGRDLAYLISGGAVMGAFLHLCNRLPGPEESWVLFFLLGGLAYFVAYALQDLSCLVGFVTTAYVSKPNRFVQWLYRRFKHEPWSKIEINVEKAHEEMADERHLLWLERISTFRQVGTTGGPCMALAGMLFFVRWYRDGSQFDFSVSLAAVALGAILVALSWLKAAQEAQFIATHAKPKPVAV